MISSKATEESMSADESVPTEASRLVDGRSVQARSQGTKQSSIIKWILCAGAGWTLIGTFAVLIGSKFFSGSRWSANTYTVNNLPYFHDFDPGNGTTMNSSISVAFIGNGMQYVNDLPRFMETLSEGNITQNSCFRTGSSLNTITIHGNGMSPYWNTSAAHINGTNVYDFGACTVKQLLFGRDDHLHEVVSKGHYKHNPLIGNPCLEYPEYMDYLNSYYAQNKKPKWDFVVLNDNSRDPSQSIQREKGLEALGDKYVPWFERTGAIPVFLDTHAYHLTPKTDIPTFSSITYEGYEQYAAVFESFLPASQKPRIAPVGIVFLTVLEEDQLLWQKLFESDGIHLTPLGTFLQGCVIHYTLLGRMPTKNALLRDDMSELWWNARAMKHSGTTPDPFPSKEDAEYVYNIVERVVKGKHLPKAFFTRKDEHPK
jgi:hypothetical protein